MTDVFLYLVLFLVALWTARLAMSKGRNAWGWGGAALISGMVHVPESALLSVVPVLVLLFVLKPSTSPATEPDRHACPRCAKSHSGGQHFCTGCGWDLSVSYSPEEQDGATPSPSQPQAQPSMTSTAVAEPPEAAEAPAPAASATPPPAAENEVTEEPTLEEESGLTADQKPAPAAESVQDTEGETGIPAEAASGDIEAEPETEAVPWGTYVPGVAPTAAVMTARGIERYDEGKYQEAIDQFTKAIALDPNYAEAWQRRAEAYTQLGRSAQAEEDRRHHQGLDPSSSPG